MPRQISVTIDREDDGRWIAEIEALPGALAYGSTPEEARAKVEALALRILADRREHGEPVPELDGLFEAA
ncbi:MAG: type II toxin-antitoxin system HicB family antitoxin [Geminicoccaceae bacterium]|jgi:predicted RNase H-like HicB family nuclease|nr:type II toxin-antitoxin system HicB family antitoxin [Geminicoccaceae bacterium]MCB9968609.1 type II toxin-antitoxin system HicB family antitoxin [Geminicoccaceae bacterium]HRY23165.1 type II toxin-antitoxin system HicB family antitoxin [Geminicoccaceae bacterium]